MDILLDVTLGWIEKLVNMIYFNVIQFSYWNETFSKYIIEIDR